MLCGCEALSRELTVPVRRLSFLPSSHTPASQSPSLRAQPETEDQPCVVARFLVFEGLSSQRLLA